MPKSSGSSALPAVALAVAALSLALAVFALLIQRDGEPDYTQAQRDDARAGICAAFDTVRTGVAVNTNREPPGGYSDIAAALATTATARAALFDGGQYLLARMDPATPPDLAVHVRSYAEQLMDIAAAATAGLPNSDPAQADRLRRAEEAGAQIAGLCG